MVSVLAFYSNDPSANPAEVCSFCCNIVFEKNENKQKDTVEAQFLKTFTTLLATGRLQSQVPIVNVEYLSTLDHSAPVL